MAVWITILLVIIIIFLLSIIIIPKKMGERLVHPKGRDPQVCFDEKVEMGIINKEKYEATTKIPFQYESKNGYTLKGLNILRDSAFKAKPVHQVIVLVHGYTSNHCDMIPYVDMFYRNGFDIVLYDQRNHGYSEKNYTTMGQEESKDLEGIIAQVKEYFGPKLELGLMGESMGAATVMLVSSRVKDLSFVIEDCGYSSAFKEVSFVSEHNYHLLRLPYAELTRSYIFAKYNFDLKNVLPAESVAKCAEDLPYLFIHGDSDYFVPSKMLVENFNAKKGIRQMQYFKGSAHAKSYREHPAEYEKLVLDFLEKNNILYKYSI